MQLNVRGTSALTRLVLLVVFSAAWQAHAHAQNAKTPILLWPRLINT
jgi:hypothetical protein